MGKHCCSAESIDNMQHAAQRVKDLKHQVKDMKHGNVGGYVQPMVQPMHNQQPMYNQQPMHQGGDQFNVMPPQPRHDNNFNNQGMMHNNPEPVYNNQYNQHAQPVQPVYDNYDNYDKHGKKKRYKKKHH